MTEFVVTITDPDQLAGITWAREQYNAALPPLPPPEMMAAAKDPELSAVTTVEIPPPMLETDQEYVQHVMAQAAVSYADQRMRKEYQDQYEAAVTAVTARRAGG